MSVSQGRQFLSIPGPTNVPDEVLQAMHRPAMDIYAGEMIGITDSCMADLAEDFPHQGPHLHLRRQRPRRLGGGASPTCCRAAIRCWCWRAAVSPGLGRDGAR